MRAERQGVPARSPRRLAVERDPAGAVLVLHRARAAGFGIRQRAGGIRLEVARIFVERLAVLLEGAVHGRHLGDRAGEAVQRLHHLAGRALHGALAQHLAFRIARGRAHAQAHHRLVGLVGVEVQLAELGGGAEAQRQHAGGQRVQRAGMAGLFRAQQPLGLLQGLVAGTAQRLVEQQNPVHGVPLHPCTRSSRHLTVRPLWSARRRPWRSGRSCRPRARWCGRTRSAASARYGCAGA